MSGRYWMAVAGSMLGIPLMLFALAIVVADQSVPHRVWAACGMFALGWGSKHFAMVADEEI